MLGAESRRLVGVVRNLRGAVSIIARTLQDLGVTPHLVAVSTCYVAGHRRGAAPEIRVDDSPFWVDVSWRREVDAARRVRADLEAFLGREYGITHATLQVDHAPGRPNDTVADTPGSRSAEPHCDDANGPAYRPGDS